MDLILDENVEWQLEFPSVNGIITRVYAKPIRREDNLVPVYYVCDAITSKLNKNYAFKNHVAYLLEKKMYTVFGFSHESMRHTLLNPIQNINFSSGQIAVQYGSRFIKEIDPYVRWAVNAKANNND